MNPQETERLLAERTQVYMRYMALALTVIAVALIVTMVLVWKTYSENVAPAVADMRATMDEVHQMTVRTAALLQAAEQTMAEVRRATGAVAPMMGQAQQTIEQAQETTERVQAPLNILRGIPILNWFIQ